MFSSATSVLQKKNQSGKGAEEEGLASAAVQRYFDAWNRRDMKEACAQFAEECAYEDTQYASSFVGKEALEAHLNRVAEALPPTFQFCIDDLADGGSVVGVQWHVENQGKPLPFTRGCSMYRVDPSSGLLVSGFDVPEPAPLKPGGAGLALLSAASKVIEEPVRGVALVTWLAYCWVVFFSNGILPGPDATQLDPATWQEVVDLSLNFFLVAPLLHLPFSPALHPGLEGVFNLLLAWAAAFSGFAADGRKGRPHGSMVPTLAGMQLLTNAVFLPYLALRASEDKAATGSVQSDDGGDSGDASSTAKTPPPRAPLCYAEDLSAFELLVGESRLLGPGLGLVGLGSVGWGASWGRVEEYGSDFGTRLGGLQELLGHDRLGSSFVVDLALFALFQGWLVDDDLRRRGVDPLQLSGTSNVAVLRLAAKFVPFVGLCAYLAFRPPLPTRPSAEQS